MNIVNFVLVCIMCFLVIIFIALPIGIKPPIKISKGHASSAPDKPMIFLKLVLSLLLSIILTLVYFYFE